MKYKDTSYYCLLQDSASHNFLRDLVSFLGITFWKMEH